MISKRGSSLTPSPAHSRSTSVEDGEFSDVPLNLDTSNPPSSPSSSTTANYEYARDSKKKSFAPLAIFRSWGGVVPTVAEPAEPIFNDDTTTSSAPQILITGKDKNRQHVRPFTLY